MQELKKKQGPNNNNDSVEVSGLKVSDSADILADIDNALGKAKELSMKLKQERKKDDCYCR